MVRNESSLLTNMIPLSFQIKVGLKRYVSRNALIDQVEKATYFTARIEKLLLLFYKSKVNLYSVKKNSAHRITEDELSSMKSM